MSFSLSQLVSADWHLDAGECPKQFLFVSLSFSQVPSKESLKMKCSREEKKKMTGYRESP